ncbi:GREB1-like protein [Hondaea fermentalgiana]|uniref:GREB1-like protein n=1 Tax=Hondaea fermentalgiana TaxID=2315210 RepID=A0A2R5GIV1_9STRA|nr:GREB1-like protein [Hondaea fermentalgiana]|eukprot:GBG30820.1 GREB1-like protein [Hondaea fermentalgiana]
MEATREEAAASVAPPLVLVINAEAATELEEEVENSPAALRQLSGEGKVDLQALPQLLRVCWLADTDEDGLEDVAGLKKLYKEGGFEGLDLFGICLGIIADATKGTIIQRLSDVDKACLRAEGRAGFTVKLLTGLAAKRWNKDVAPQMLRFGLNASEFFKCLEDSESLQGELLQEIGGRDHETRIILICDAADEPKEADYGRVLSIVVALGSADTTLARDLLEKSTESQEKEEIDNELEGESVFDGEEQPVRIVFVAKGSNEVHGQEGELELVMPSLPEAETNRRAIAEELLIKDCNAIFQTRKDSAWEQVTRALASFGMKVCDAKEAQIKLTYDAERDGDLAEEEKPTTLCVELHVPAEAIQRRDMHNKLAGLSQPDVTFPEQRMIAEQLFGKAASALFGNQETKFDWVGRFDKVSFVVLTPNFNSLQSQTAGRVRGAMLDNGLVLKHTKYPKKLMQDHCDWMIREASNPRTLLVIVADECHFAPTKDGAHDWLLNNDMLQSDNVLRLLVSATPQNTLTINSRIKDDNIVSWYTEASLYRSMDYYVETSTWAVPKGVSPLQLKFEGETFSIDPRVMTADGKRYFRYPMHEYKAFCEVLNLRVSETLPAHATQRLTKNATYFAYARERIVLNMPCDVEILPENFQTGSGFLYWLGFERDKIDLDKKKPTRGKPRQCIRLNATSVPLFCDTERKEEHNDIVVDCMPRRRQRVLKDAAFDTVRELIEDSYGKRTAQKRKQQGVKVSPSTPLYDGHIVLADYLLSLTYLAIYRVDRKKLWDQSIERETIFRDLELHDIGQLVLNTSLLVEFATHLGFAKRLEDSPDKAREVCINKGRGVCVNKPCEVCINKAREVCVFDIAGGIEEASVQHLVDILLEATLQGAWKELALEKVQNNLRERLGNAWVDKMEALLPYKENEASHSHWRFGWQYIISEKLARNREDDAHVQGNTSEAWFNETDRLLHDLLDVHPRYRTGRMAVIRVYETDENLSIQDCLRCALKKLGLTHVEHGGILSVVADVGGSDGKKAESAARGKMKKARAATSLFQRLESWSLTRDLRHPAKQARAPGASETIVDRVNRSYAESKAREEFEAQQQNRKPVPVSEETAKYEDLENLPSIVILCEKGRMGDTFPHSFRFLDIRLRSSETFSTFVQEFGRVCRYPTLDADEATIGRFKVTKADAQEADTALEEALTHFLSGDSVRQYFAKGGSFAVLDPGNEVRFHADSEQHFRSKFRQSLQQQSISRRSLLGTWTAQRYVHVLPTVLMNAKRYNAQLQKAVEHKYRDARGLQRIDQCIPGNIDLYMWTHQRSRTSKAAHPKTVPGRTSEGAEVINVENPLHDIAAYRKTYPSGSQVTGDLTAYGSRPAHYDCDHDGTKDPRRLLLMAQCQQGKTGTYLHFIRLLKEAIEVDFPASPSALAPIKGPSWIWPYWADLAVAKCPPMREVYDKPRKSHQHPVVLQQRVLALLAACRDTERWLEKYTQYLSADDGEGIKSKAGIDCVRNLQENLQEANSPPFKGPHCDDMETAAKCINFDGRFTGSWRDDIQAQLNDKENLQKMEAALPGGLTLALSKSALLQATLAQIQEVKDIAKRALMIQSEVQLPPLTRAQFAQRHATYAAVAARKVSPLFDRRYREKPYVITNLQVVGEDVSLSIPYAGFQGLTADAHANHVQGFISNGMNESRMSLFEVNLEARNMKTLADASAVRWVFVPSFDRAGVALLDYEHAIPRNDDIKPTVICIVVRSGRQFEEYVASYGSAHLVLSLPSRLTVPSQLEENVSHLENGPYGFARLFIQLVASDLDLPWVWILDDDVDVCFQRDLVDNNDADADKSPTALAQPRIPKPCTFSAVMRGVEDIVHGEDTALKAALEHFRDKHGTLLATQAVSKLVPQHFSAANCWASETRSWIASQEGGTLHVCLLEASDCNNFNTLALYAPENVGKVLVVVRSSDEKHFEEMSALQDTSFFQLKDRPKCTLHLHEEVRSEDALLARLLLLDTSELQPFQQHGSTTDTGCGTNVSSRLKPRRSSSSLASTSGKGRRMSLHRLESDSSLRSIQPEIIDTSATLDAHGSATHPCVLDDDASKSLGAFVPKSRLAKIEPLEVSRRVEVALEHLQALVSKRDAAQVESRRTVVHDVEELCTARELQLHLLGGTRTAMSEGRQDAPLALVVNAQRADDFADEVDNSPEALLALASEGGRGRLEVAALTELLRICWLPEGLDAATSAGDEVSTVAGALGGLEDVDGLKKVYTVHWGNIKRKIDGLDILSICLNEIIGDGPLASVNDASLNVPTALSDVRNLLANLAEKRLSSQSESALQPLRRSGRRSMTYVQLRKSDSLQKELETELAEAEASGTRVIVLRDMDEEDIESIILVIHPDERRRIRELLEQSRSAQEAEDIEDENEDDTDVLGEDQPVQIYFVTRGTGDAHEQEGQFELTMPLFPEAVTERQEVARELLLGDGDAIVEARKNIAWEQLARALARLGLKLRQRPHPDVRMAYDPERDEKLSESEKRSILCVCISLPEHAIDRERIALQPPGEAQPDVAHPEQRDVAEELFRKAGRALFPEQETPDWVSRFDKVSFVVLTPNFNSLQSQTADRVRRAMLENGRVLKHTKVPHSVMEDHRAWMEAEARDPRTLLVIIADECHYAPTKNGAHDWLLNNKHLNGKNVLRLLVSATPQNVLTNKSRIAPQNVVCWHRDASLYRSMDYYVETATWAVPEDIHPLRLKVTTDGNAQRVIEVHQDVAPDCLPRRRQRVLRDEAFQTMKDNMDAAFGKRNNAKRKQIGTRVASSTPLYDGHFIMVDYLLSLVFLAVYRVEFLPKLWNSGTKDDERTTIFKALNKDVIRQDACDDNLLKRFATHLGFATKLWPNASPRRSMEVGSFKSADGTEDASVQPVINVLLKRMYTEVWSELREHEVKEALRVRLGQDWVDALEAVLRQEDENNQSKAPLPGRDCDDRESYIASAWLLAWQYIVSEKLERNMEDHADEQGNTSQTWYNETDRLLHDLLDVDPQYHTGRMAVVRVYETDENLSIQDCLRSALKKLELTDAKHGGVLSVIADVGGNDAKRRSRSGRREEASRGATSLLNQIEDWTLTRDLRHPSLQRDKPEDSETLVDRVNTSFAEAKAREELEAAEKGHEPKSVQKEAKYEDLENLPAIVILCEKGRMGDTFPHSFRFLDIRLRSSKTYSTFVQEFGRVCRYPGLDADESSIARFKVMKTAHDDGTDNVEWTALEEDLASFFANNDVKRFFAKGGSYAVLDPGKQVRFHADSEHQLRSGLLRALQLTPEDAGVQSRFGIWTAKRYVHVLPTVLMNKDRFNNQVQKAIEHKYRGTWGMRRIDQCIPGQLDNYIAGPGRGRRRPPVPSASLNDQGEIDVTNPLHDLFAYRRHRPIAPTRRARQGAGAAEGKEAGDEGILVAGRNLHYDSSFNGGQDPRRLLLMAQCQQGKTGTYLHFIRLLKDVIELDVPMAPPPMVPVPRKLWTLPYWGNLVVSKFPQLRVQYDKPNKGQYHPTVMQQRILALMLACEQGQRWLKNYKNYLRAEDGEAIQSEAGLAKIRKLDPNPAFDKPFENSRCSRPDIAIACVNFDGRFSGEWEDKVAEQLQDENVSKLSSALAENNTQPTPPLEGISVMQRFVQHLRAAKAFVQSMLWDAGARGQHPIQVGVRVRSHPMLVTRSKHTQMHTAYAPVAARPVTPQFDNVYNAKQHVMTDLSFIGEGACLSVPYSGFCGLAVRADVNGAEVFMSADDSSPETSLLNVDTTTRTVRKSHGTHSVRWAFIPSYNRAGVALLDYDRAIPKDGDSLRTVVCIVVRSGKQFDDYVAAYGSAHLVLGLPSKMPSKKRPGEFVFADRGGIGFARLFIQLAASQLKLNWVWILDDNVDVCYERTLVDDSVPLQTLRQGPAPCTFATVMKGVEAIVQKRSEQFHSRRMHEWPRALVRGKPAPRAAATARATNTDQFIGGAENYGLIGIRRDAQARQTESEHPFMISYSVYSFIYLNVKSTVKKGVFFPVKTFWEDVEFNHLVDEAGLVCLKVNRFFHHKKNLKLGSRRANRKIIESLSFPDGLRPALEHFRDTQGGLKAVPPVSGHMRSSISPADRWASEVYHWIDGFGRPGPHSIQVCLVEFSKVSKYNTLALHTPPHFSKLLIVIRTCDEEHFQEVSGELLSVGVVDLKDRVGCKLFLHNEAVVDTPFACRLILVGSMPADIARPVLQRRSSSSSSVASRSSLTSLESEKRRGKKRSLSQGSIPSQKRAQTPVRLKQESASRKRFPPDNNDDRTGKRQRPEKEFESVATKEEVKSSHSSAMASPVMERQKEGHERLQVTPVPTPSKTDPDAESDSLDDGMREVCRKCLEKAKSGSMNLPDSYFQHAEEQLKRCKGFKEFINKLSPSVFKRESSLDDDDDNDDALTEDAKTSINSLKQALKREMTKFRKHSVADKGNHDEPSQSSPAAPQATSTEDVPSTPLRTQARGTSSQVSALQVPTPSETVPDAESDSLDDEMREVCRKCLEKAKSGSTPLPDSYFQHAEEQLRRCKGFKEFINKLSPSVFKRVNGDAFNEGAKTAIASLKYALRRDIDSLRAQRKYESPQESMNDQMSTSAEAQDRNASGPSENRVEAGTPEASEETMTEELRNELQSCLDRARKKEEEKRKENKKLPPEVFRYAEEQLANCRNGDDFLTSLNVTNVNEALDMSHRSDVGCKKQQQQQQKKKKKKKKKKKDKKEKKKKKDKKEKKEKKDKKDKKEKDKKDKKDEKEKDKKEKDKKDKKEKKNPVQKLKISTLPGRRKIGWKLAPQRRVKRQ